MTLPTSVSGTTSGTSSDAAVDSAAELPFQALPDLIREYAVNQPDQPALIQSEQVLTYAQLDAQMDRVAATLQRDGVGPATTIALCATTSLAYAVVFLASLRVGAAVAPLAPSSSAQTLAAMAQDAGAQILFLDHAVADSLAALSAVALPRLVTLDQSPLGAHLDDWLLPFGSKPGAVAIQPDWPFNIIYSSGTTGAPKGIVQSHAMRWAHIQRAGINGYGASAVSLISTPLYSNTTLVCFLPTLGLGGTVLLMAKFDAAAYLDLAQRYRATHTMLVPVQYQRIMARADFDQYDLSAFQMKFCTSAPFPAALKADIVRRWPGGLIEYYGMTEGGGTCMLLAHQFPDKLHTVGQPAPGHDIRLIDAHGHEVAAGAMGEVVGHSPAMMLGYHNQPEKTRAAEWFDASGKRFIRTGDLGRFDADGFLILMDRQKDMIISGGFNVYPSDLELVLQQHPDLLEVAVVGVASERWGETPVAFVVPKAGVTIDIGAVLEWANARLGKTQRLAALQISAQLPRSPIGKILKRELRDGFTAQVR